MPDEESSPDDAAKRGLMLAALGVSLGAGLAGPSAASASPLDPAQTQITLPADIAWKTAPGAPPRSFDSAMLFGALDKPGQYFTLVRWWPGYMSGPHTYLTDRLCVVLSGVWWANSGADFDPSACKPVPAGSFVRRVAGTPHYDGVRAIDTEPAIIAISGIAPVGMKLVEPKGGGLIRRV